PSTTTSASILTPCLLFHPKQQETSGSLLTFTAHIASVSRSCRFALYNIRKIRPYLTQYATQLLVQTLVSPPNGPAGLHGETTTDDPQRCGASGVQPTEKGTRHPATH